MSDEDREIDIESDADDEEGSQTFGTGLLGEEEDDKRAHHNALERKRRDHIKDSFHSLRDCVPQDDKQAASGKGNSSSKTSRAQILRQAAEYIIRMREKTVENDKHIQILKKQNEEYHAQIKALQKSQAGKTNNHASSSYHDHHRDEDYESYEEETVVTSPPSKKKKKTSHS